MPDLKALADKLHRAAHDGTVDFKSIDEVVAELRGPPAADKPASPAEGVAKPIIGTAPASAAGATP